MTEPPVDVKSVSSCRSFFATFIVPLWFRWIGRSEAKLPVGLSWSITASYRREGGRLVLWSLKSRPIAGG